MNTWEVIIYEGNGIWNWKANNDSDCKIPIFGKTFDSETKAKIDFEKYANLVGIKNYEYITEKESKEE